MKTAHWVIAVLAVLTSTAYGCGGDDSPAADGPANWGGSSESGIDAGRAGGTGGSGAGGEETGVGGAEPAAGAGGVLSGGSGGIEAGATDASAEGGGEAGGDGGDSAAGGSGGPAAGSGGEGPGGSGGIGVVDGGGVDPPSTFSIVVDYRFDSVDAFGDPDRRAVLAYAASTWQQYIGSEFEDIPAGTALRTRHPEQPDEPGIVYELEYDIDDLVIMVGFADTGGHLATTSVSFTYQVSDPDLLERLDERFYGMVYQPWIVETTFDPTPPWFVDPTPETSDDIPAGENDFLSTVMHEMGHALGFGDSEAFKALISDGSFVGPNATEVHGGPVPMAPDLWHFESGTLHAGKEPLMEYRTTRGTRKSVTALDLAALEDIGYEIRWSALE